MKFTSQAQEIRHYTKELLADNEEHELKEIKQYVLQRTGKVFEHGAYAGALRDLVAKERDYINPRRGIYIHKISPTSLKEIAQELLQETICKLYDEVRNMNGLTIKSEDFRTIEEIRKTIEVLEERKNQFMKC